MLIFSLGLYIRLEITLSELGISQVAPLTGIESRRKRSSRHLTLGTLFCIQRRVFADPPMSIR